MTRREPEPVNKTSIEKRIPDDVIRLDRHFRKVYPCIVDIITPYRNCKFITYDDLMTMDAKLHIRGINFHELRPLLLQYFNIQGEPTEKKAIRSHRNKIETELNIHKIHGRRSF